MKRSTISVLLTLASLYLAGDWRASAPTTPPSHIELNELKGPYGPVGFHHEAHSAIAGGCKDCHHRQFGNLVSCGLCHTEYVEREHFNHQLHENLAGCLSCHQVATMAEMRCSACHKTTYDLDRLHVIGLKGAFHQQCLGCHQAVGLDVSCTACHEPIRSGDP